MNTSPEIDKLLQDVLALQSRDDLNHHEKKELYEKKRSLQGDIYSLIFKEDETFDSILFMYSFEEILINYCKDNKHDFVTDIKKRYKLKCRRLEAEERKEENPDEAEIRKIKIRESLRSIASQHGMDSKDITASLKFNMLNRERVHQFLLLNCGYSDEEWQEFQRTVFDRRYTGSMDAEPNDDSVENKFLTEASNRQADEDEDEENEASYVYDEAIDYVLRNSFDFSDKRGKNYQNETKGYWAIQFVKGDVGEKRAEEKEEYINFRFYKANKHLYRKYEKSIVFNELNKDIDKDKDITAKLTCLRKKLVKKLHNILMPKMSEELNLRPDTWRKNYADINRYIWQLFNEWHLVKE